MLSRVHLFATLWTVAHQSMGILLWPLGFSRPEYWSGLPCPPPGDLSNPEIKPRSATLQAFPLPSKSPGKPKNTGVGSLSLLYGIFLTQELNWGLLHCRQILYQLSHQGSLRILEWVAYPFSRRLPDLVIELRSPALLVDSLPTELSGKRSFLKALRY